MSKKRKKQITKKPSDLKEPFPSSPSSPPKYGLYFRRGGKIKAYIPFLSMYAAKKFLMAALQEFSYKWVDGTSDGMGEAIRDETGLIIEGAGLESILDYKYSKSEEEWELPPPYAHQALHIRSHRPPPAEHLVVPEEPKKPRKERKPREPRPDRSGLISIADIAQELDMKPGEARAILRKSKIEKPSVGWAWSTEDADKIRTVLQA